MAALEHGGTAGANSLMRRVAASIAVVGLFVAASAAAQGSGQRIHRCTGAHGETVFSGLPCSALAPELAKPATTAPANTRDVAGALACPTTPEELQRRIADAVTRQDANALAALLRWDGLGTRSAASGMAELRSLVAQPLLAVEPGMDADHVEVRTGNALSRAVQALDFRVTTEGSCLWLGW